MNDSSLAAETPFLPTIPDEESELRALVRALSFAEKFSLLFMRCNQPMQRQRLMVAAQKQLPQMVIQEIHLREPVHHLLDEIRQRMTEPPPDAVFVSGLEHSLPFSEHAHVSPFVANLNVARDLFARDVHCPLVLWVPEYVLVAIMQGAPDFFSIRSGVFSFVLTLSETVTLIHPLISETTLEASNLPAEEKRERIQAIEALLSDYQSLAPLQRDRRTEAQLLDRLGQLFFYFGSLNEAEKKFRDSLDIWQEVGHRNGVANSYHYLGRVAQERGAYDEAMVWYRQSLAIAEELGNRIGMAASYGQIALLFTERGEVDEAVRLNLKSLSLHTELQSPNVNFNLHLLQQQREQLDEEQFLAALRKQCDEKTMQGLLELLGQNHHK